MKMKFAKMTLLTTLLMSSPTQAKTLNVIATAYCHCSICCGKNANGITTSGLKVRTGMIAVDKKIIPLGTQVRINNKNYLAADTGSAIKGKRIDIYKKTHKEALMFGRQKLKIEF